MTRFGVGIVSTVVAVCVAAGAPASALAGQKGSRHREAEESSRDVFSLMTPLSEDELEIVPDPGKTVIRRRFVAADPLDLIAPRPRASRFLGRRWVRLALFGGRSLDAKLVRVIPHSSGRAGNSFTWFGYIPQQGIGDVILTVVDGVMMGTIYDNDRVYMLRPVAQRNAFELAELDLGRLPPDHEAEEAPSGSLSDVYAARQTRSNRFFTGRASPASGFRNLGGLLEPVKAGRDDSGISFKVDSGAQIDVMVAYSPEAEQKATELRVDGEIFAGVTNIDLLIEHAVDKGNWALLASGVPTQLNLVKKLRLEGPEPTSELINAIKVGGVYYDQVLSAADQSRADIISLFLAGPETLTACGQGEILDELVEPEDQTFFQGRGKFSAKGKHWVFASCALEGFALIHELGHNAGLMHDHYALPPGNVGATPIGFGFVLVPPRRTTIMATERLCREILDEECPRIPRFSDPLAGYQDWFLGTYGGPFIDPANSVDAFIEALSTVANFRPSALPPP